MLKDQSGSKGGSLAEALGSYLQGTPNCTDLSSAQHTYTLIGKPAYML
jgi:hypothetical protein